MRSFGTPTLSPKPLTTKTPLHTKYLTALKVATSLPLYRVMPDKRRYTAWLRTELESAGCLFIKIGQWVSTRDDIFPSDVTAAFSTLQKDVSPMTPDGVREALEETPLDGLVIDADPVSCGSVAQVHTGSYKGRPVAVKLQRPNVASELREDLSLMRCLLAPLRLNNKKSYDDAVKSLDDLGTAILNETDFEAEAANMAMFADFFEGSDVVVPRVHLVAPRVIVMDFVPSTRIADSAWCQRLMDLFLVQFFELGYIHTDMHAGNLGVTEDGKLVLYDFGSVSKCPNGMRTCVKHMFVGYLNRNPSVMLDYLVEHDVLRTRAPLTADQRRALERFVETILEYVETTDITSFAALRSVPMPDSFPDVEFCPEAFMVLRSFTLLEGLCKEIDPSFQILESIVPFAATLLTDPEMYRMKVEDDLRTAAKLFE